MFFVLDGHGRTFHNYHRDCNRIWVQEKNIFFSKENILTYRLIKAVPESMLVAEPSITLSLIFWRGSPICRRRHVNPLTIISFMDTDHKRLFSVVLTNGNHAVNISYLLIDLGLRLYQNYYWCRPYSSCADHKPILCFRIRSSRWDSNIVFASCSSPATFVSIKAALRTFIWFSFSWLFLSNIHSRAVVRAYPVFGSDYTLKIFYTSQLWHFFVTATYSFGVDGLLNSSKLGLYRKQTCRVLFLFSKYALCPPRWAFSCPASCQDRQTTLLSLVVGKICQLALHEAASF